MDDWCENFDLWLLSVLGRVKVRLGDCWETLLSLVDGCALGLVEVDIDFFLGIENLVRYVSMLLAQIVCLNVAVGFQGVD